MSITSQYEGRAVDITLKALADQHRRLVVRYLKEAPNGIASPTELAEYIATEGSAGEAREEVAIRLHHSNLPKLADANIIEYDSQRDVVQYQSNPLVEKLLATVED